MSSKSTNKKRFKGIIKTLSKSSTKSDNTSNENDELNVEPITTFVGATTAVWNRSKKFELAIQAGSYDEVARMLDEGVNPNEKNDLGNTPLHTAAKMCSKNIMELLINWGADVNYQNNNKMAPLHLVTLSRGFDSSKDLTLECIKLLLRSNAVVDLKDHSGATALHLSAIRSEEKWVDALIEAGACLCERMDDGTLALYYVMKNCPNSIKRSLDACFLGFNGNLNKGKLEYIIKSSDKEKAEVKLDYSHLQTLNNDPTAFFQNVLDMKNKDPTLKETVKDTFLHPSSQAFIYYKWRNVVWWYYIFVLCSHLIYCIVFSIYATTVFKDICCPEDLKENEWKCEWAKASKDIKGTAKLSLILMIPFTGILTFKQLIHFFQRLWHVQNKEYSTWMAKIRAFSNLSAFTGWLIILTFSLSSFPLITQWPNDEPNKDNSSITVHSYQYHAVVYGVFLSWLDMMFLWGRATKVGLYVKLLKKVSKTFIKSMYAYLPLFVAFALAFFILFPNMGFSQNFGHVVLKVLAMLSGELEYEEMVENTEERIIGNITGHVDNSTGTFLGQITDVNITSKSVPLPFPVSDHLFIGIFVFFMSIIMINLLFGLAVSDVQEQLKRFQYQQLVQQVELICSINTILNKLPKPLKGSGQACRYKVHRTATYGNTKMKLKQNKKMACKMYGTEVEDIKKPCSDLELGQRYSNRENLNSLFGIDVMIPKKIMSLIYEREKEIKMKQTDEKTESQKIEKLLEKTLNEHFDRMSRMMNKPERKMSTSIPDAKYLPPKPNSLATQIQVTTQPSPLINRAQTTSNRTLKTSPL